MPPSTLLLSLQGTTQGGLTPSETTETIVDVFIAEAGGVDNPNKDDDKFETSINMVKGTYRSAGEREQGEDDLLATSLAEDRNCLAFGCMLWF